MFFKEISILYEAFRENKPSPLPELEIQYADYAVWQREHIKGEVLTKQSEYWQHKLSDVSILELPTDKARPAKQTSNGANQDFCLDQDILEKLNSFSKGNDVTLFMTLLSVFKVLLSRYTGQDDICVGSPIANRTRSEIEPLIGFFVNTLALRSDLSGDISFLELVKQVKQTTLEAYDNQDIPFEQVVDIVQPERNLSYSPLFQVMMVLQNTPVNELTLGELSLKPYKFERAISKFDLTLNFTETSEGLVGRIEYNTDLFDKNRIERMIGHFTVLVESIISNPTVKISELEILTSEEKHQLLVEWNDTAADYPKDKCIHQLFEEQVERTPDNIAVVFENEQLTYRELNEQSNNLAVKLNNISNENELAAIYVEPSLEMIIGILGILKSGMGFLPLDPEHSTKRHEKILEDCNCDFLIIQEHLENELSFSGQKIILSKNAVTNSSQKVTTKSSSSDLAYVIYTSGSTGKPKGVKISKQNLLNYCSWFIKKSNFDQGDKVILTSSYAFDLVYTLFFSSLISGGELHVIPRETYLSPPKLIEYIRNEGISFLKMTPTLFNMVISDDNFNHASFAKVRLLVLGGEPINVEDVSKLSNGSRHIKIMNHYGPTETTIGSIARYISHEEIEDFVRKPTIGKPIYNTKCYILGKNQELLPLGCKGELYIGGDGVGVGYLGQRILTEEKYVANPFCKGEWMYKTGDMARWLPSGDIEFLGRIDDQVKIRGYRIELGEIRSVLNMHGRVEDSVAIANERGAARHMVCYYVSCGEITVKELREHLSFSLPDYMIPDYFVRLDRMPISPNGKVNRKLLPLPEIKAGDNHVASSNDIQIKLVAIWSQILHLPENDICIKANFFELGGNSLKVIKLVGLVNREFGKEFSVVEMFENPTIKKLSKAISISSNNTYKEEFEEYEEKMVQSGRNRKLLHKLRNEGYDKNE